MIRKIITVAVLVVLTTVAPSFCLEEEGNQKAIKLEDITVKGQAMPVSEYTTTVNVVDSEMIQDLQVNRTDEILNEVPGVEIGNYNMGGVANVVQIRGFSSGGHGGDLGVYLDGIPLNEGESHADGYADMNVIIPMEIEHLEVYKGPSSALFGNFARGGVVSFHTKKRGEYSKLKTEYGAYNTVDVQGAFGSTFGNSVFNNTAIQLYRTDGYQDNQKWLKGNASTRFSADITDALDVSVSLRFHSSEWDAPGYIPKAQFDDTEAARHQAVNAEDDGGDKTFYTERIDVGYTLSESLRLLFWGYGTQQDFTRFAKMGYTAGGQTERYYDRGVYGAGTSLNLNTSVASYPTVGVIGIEYYNEDTEWKRWNTSNRVRTAQTEDRDFNINTVSLFGEADMEISQYFRPHLGLRYDNFGGDYENRDPGSTPFNYDMQDYDYFSPKVGFRSRILDPVDLRVSYSEGFSLPDGPDKYDPSMNVDPEEIKQYEIGLTLTPTESLWFDIAGFIMDTENEVQENPPGSGTYNNVGKTRREGLELAARFSPVKPIQFFGDLSLIDTEIKENADSSLVGKALTSIPESILNLGIKYTSPIGVGAMIKWRSVGDYWIDDANTEKYSGYEVIDAEASYTIQDHKGTKYRLFVNIDNLLDEHYTTAAWSGYGTTNYAVSWPRTFYVGIAIDM